VELPIREEIKVVEIPIEEVSEISIIQSQSKSEAEILDTTIEGKIKELMPSIIQKVKNELSEESKLSSSKISEVKYSEKVIHSRITCDGCQKHGIEGVRYKCAVCPDFDFC